MGMDVYGLNPAGATGRYFHNSAWWWRPLWEYCMVVDPAGAGQVAYELSNDGAGLAAPAAALLADYLQAELDSGRTAAYSAARAVRLAALPPEQCPLCRGTGRRAAPPAVAVDAARCNGCAGAGVQPALSTYYRFAVDNVEDFVAFLRECGGFEVW